MTEKKTRIRELVEELKLSQDAVIAAAREEGINVKGPQTAISAEDADKVRKRLTKPDDQKKVIVRRRKTRPAPEPQVEAQAGTSSEAASDASSGTASTAEESAAAKDEPAKAEVPKAESAEAKDEKPAPPRAKVISRPKENIGAEEAEKAAKAAREASAAAAAAAAEEAGKADAAPADAAAASAQVQAGAEGAAKPEGETKAAAEKAEAKADAQTGARADAKTETAPQAGKDAGKDAKDESARPRPFASGMPDAPRVRIISRPSPAQQRPKTESSDEGRGQREGDRRSGAQAKDGQRSDNRRGAGAAQPRTGGQRPGGRDGGSMGSDFGGGDSRNGQSKKKRNKGRRTVDFQQMGFDGQDDSDAPRMRGGRNRKKKVQAPTPATQPLKAAKRKVRVEGTIRVSDMAHQMGLKANELIKVLFNLGIMATINQSIDFDTAAILASEFNYEVEKTGFEEKDYLEDTTPDRPEDLKPRPPVVTIMGHVDHGKTSLLDAIRKTHVTSDEAGGITQHIGAYHVNTKNGDVVFLDTPGHEAFTAMRARGAQITDLVILVVAADDGVMEQTREAINHAKAAEVPIIVAVNKMDKPGADPDRVLRELAELGLQAEEWGGDTIVAKVSAKTGQGLDDLLELLALQSEVMELKANPDKPARGHIIEAKLDKGRGPVATVLIQEGTLHQGDNFVCGTFSGRVRALLNDQGKKVREAGPSIPVEVQGFTGVPDAGEVFAAVADEKVARRIADERAIRLREKTLASESKVTLETFLAASQGEEQKTLNLVVKADVQGSLEAVQESLRKAGTDKVAVSVVHGGTGAISESDIMLASASKAIIIGFNIRPTARVKEVAAHENVDIRFYDIIYKLVDDVKSAMAGLLAPVEKEVYLGQAEVRQTFTLPKVGTIAGSYVADGKILRNARVRLLRDGVVVYTGRVSSLKRFKDDAREVLRGNECGIGLENFNDIKDGDIIEAFDTVQEAATL